MGKWIPPHIPASEGWSVVYRVIVPKQYRPEVMRRAHEIPLGGQWGIAKTCDKVTKHFMRLNTIGLGTLVR